MLQKNCVYKAIMAESVSTNAGKRRIQIDISSDTVCPWCFVGKKNLDKAVAASKDQYDFEVFSPYIPFVVKLLYIIFLSMSNQLFNINPQIRWHPYQLDPNSPKEGVVKREYYHEKFGPQFARMEARMSEVLLSFLNPIQTRLFSYRSPSYLTSYRFSRSLGWNITSPD